MNPKDVDPAVVSSSARTNSHSHKDPTAHKPRREHQAPPKPAVPQVPITASIISKTLPGEGDSTAFPIDYKRSAVVYTSDDKVVAIPRSSGALVPGATGKAVAGAAVESQEPIKSDLPACVLIAVHHWVETKGAQGTAEAKFASPVVHVEFDLILTSEWEKQFWHRLLDTPAALFGTINFAEANKMAGLLEFCVVGLSCNLRGKGPHELAEGLGHNVEEFTEDELSAGAQAYPWAAEMCKPKAE